MRNIKNIYLIILALFLIAFPTVIHAQSKLPSIPIQSIAAEKNYVEGEVIVKYKINTKKQQLLKTSTEKNESPRLLQSLQETQSMHDLKIKNTFKNLNITTLQSDIQSTQDLITKLEQDPEVEYAEPNYRKYPTSIPNDTYFKSTQWALYNTGQELCTPDCTTGTIDDDIDATNAWDIEISAAQKITVAVIDSGLNYNHEDLLQNLWNGASCVNENGTTIHGGCPYHGWDYADNDNNPADTTGSAQGHGTSVSSIFGATTNNSKGLAGISLYGNVKVMALRFDLDTISEIKAIEFAKNNGVKIINASFAGDAYSQSEKDAIDAFPGIFITASGNGGIDGLRDNNDVTPQYPCNYSSSNIICVGASDQNDNLASFSNYGQTSVDLVAPGVNILIACDNVYCTGDGTSFSTPYVTGVAAILSSHNTKLSTSQVKSLILDNVDNVGLSTQIKTGGRLNMYKSLYDLKTSYGYSYSTKPVYRFYSPSNKAHFFTVSETEKNHIVATYPTTEWRYENIAYYVPTTSTGNKPVYRFYSPRNKAHFFTVSETEKNHIVATYPTTEWRYENIAYYVPTTSTGNKPVYRFYSPRNKAHFFTVSESEKNHIVATYPTTEWRYENIAYYVPK
ncbi:MAG: S8 family serine peptidase [Candidatus Moraniibacteriota bacterium]|jgi:subtilisin family serine protease